MTSIEQSLWTQTFAFSIAWGRALDTAAFNAARSVLLFRGQKQSPSLEDARAMLEQMRALSSVSVESETLSPFTRLGGT